MKILFIIILVLSLNSCSLFNSRIQTTKRIVNERTTVNQEFPSFHKDNSALLELSNDNKFYFYKDKYLYISHDKYDKDRAYVLNYKEHIIIYRAELEKDKYIYITFVFSNKNGSWNLVQISKKNLLNLKKQSCIIY